MTYQQALDEFRQAVSDEVARRGQAGAVIERQARLTRYRIHSRGRDGVETIGKETYVAWRAEEIADGLNAMPAMIKEGIYHWIEAVEE